MSRNARIISKMADKCNRLCIIGIIATVLATTWLALEMLSHEPFSTLPIVIFCMGCALSMSGMYIGKTIEDVK